MNDIDAGGDVVTIQTSGLLLPDAFYAVRCIDIRRKVRLIFTTTSSLTSLSGSLTDMSNEILQRRR